MPPLSLYSLFAPTSNFRHNYHKTDHFIFEVFFSLFFCIHLNTVEIPREKFQKIKYNFFLFYYLNLLVGFHYVIGRLNFFFSIMKSWNDFGQKNYHEAVQPTILKSVIKLPRHKAIKLGEVDSIIFGQLKNGVG